RKRGGAARSWLVAVRVWQSHKAAASARYFNGQPGHHTRLALLAASSYRNRRCGGVSRDRAAPPGCWASHRVGSGWRSFRVPVWRKRLGTWPDGTRGTRQLADQHDGWRPVSFDVADPQPLSVSATND